MPDARAVEEVTTPPEERAGGEHERAGGDCDRPGERVLVARPPGASREYEVVDLAAAVGAGAAAEMREATGACDLEG